MFGYSRLRQLYESRVNDPNRAGSAGRHRFVTDMRHVLGLCDADGLDYKDRKGNRQLRESQADAEEFTLGELGAAIIGPGWREYFDPQSPGSLGGVQAFRLLQEAYHPGDPRALLEATGVGVDVSAFANINAWTGVVGGLIERKILEGFTNPDYILEELMPIEPTKIHEGQKVIGVGRIGDKSKRRQPGEPHQRAGYGERYVVLPSTRELAMACEVFKETAFYDLTGKVMEEAASVGDWLSYRREIEGIDAFIGVSTQSAGEYPFNYKGTAYNTYSTTAQNQANGVPLGFVNQQSNELIDWTNFEASYIPLTRFTDPETQTRVNNSAMDTVIVNVGKLATAEMIAGASTVERRTAIGSTQANASVLTVAEGAKNPAYKFGVKRILWSQLLEQRCTDVDGLNLTQTNATKRWWHFLKGRFMKYMQNWPLTITQAPATNYDMIDRGIITAHFANERGCPSVWSPWHVMMNTA